MPDTRRHHAVVIGAGIGGLAAARVLADRFDKVTIVDRDALPEEAQPRKGVPQGRHAHALLAGGARGIAELFPGIMEELIAAGAVPLDFNEGRWFQAGGYRAPSNLDRKVISASRPFIEGHLRRRVALLDNVTVESGAAVAGLAHQDGRVRGVHLVDADGERTLVADLVVDCSGRASQAPRWLADMGYAEPEVAEVRCDVRYGSMLLRRSPGDLDATFSVSIESPPHGKRSGFLVPIEGGRWIATIAASFGVSAPVDLETFRAIAATLPSPEMHSVIRDAEPLGAVATHRLTSSRRRRYEKLRRVPAGFLALGDSICSFNPIYGQGMSSAVLQAIELRDCLGRTTDDEHLPRTFYKRAAKVIANPWQIAVGADFAHPECRGPKPRGTDMINRYLAQVLVAAQTSSEVNTAMILVQNLLAPPGILLRPSMVRTVRRHSSDRKPLSPNSRIGAGRAIR